MPSTKSTTKPTRTTKPRAKRFEPTPIWDREFATRFAKITGRPVVKTGYLPR